MLSHIRTPRAAVAAATPDDDQQFARQREPVRSTSQTLWASRPFSVRAGRLVAVRLLGEELRVGLATSDGGSSGSAVMTRDKPHRFVALHAARMPTGDDDFTSVEVKTENFYQTFSDLDGCLKVNPRNTTACN